MTNSILKSVIIASALTTLVSGTSYGADLISERYFGEASFNTVPDSVEINSSGVVKQAFATKTVTHSRTGELVKDIRFTGNWGGITLPAGTRLYAIPFKDHFEVGIKKMMEDESLPNIAWCSPYLKPDSKKLACIGARKNGSLNIFTSYGYSRYYPEYFSGNSTTNWIEGPPEIIEKPVSFDVDLKMEISVRKIKKKEVKVRVDLNDGEKTSRITYLEIDREADGSALLSIWGGEIKIIPNGKKEFSIEQTKPFPDQIGPAHEKLIPPFALYVN